MFPRSTGRLTLRFALGVLGILLPAVTALPPEARAVSSTIVISQVYGGGGNTGAIYRNDFIEIFNRGSTTVNITGWTVQYASSGGATWSSTTLSGSIVPGAYYLIQEAQGAGGTMNLPTPDASGGIAMSATAGKVALVSSVTLLTGTCPTSASIVDLVGYGAASCSEGAPVGVLDNTTAALRNSEGCEDTDDNLSDFTRAAPVPRNSASPVHTCQYTLGVTVDPVGGGSVTKEPDQPTYQHGTTVNLTASQAMGYHFVDWTGDASSTANPLTLIMNGNKSVVAHFALNAAYSHLVISQVYGGGGNGGATYRNDFVEIFNRGNVSVNVTGWTIQYAAATGSTWSTTTLLGSIVPGGYYLIQEAQGAGGTMNLPTPDAIGTIAMSALAGKVALVNSTTPLTGNCPTSGSIIDLVGYGGADCSENTPVPTLDNTTAALRNGGGCDDTDHNQADFTRTAPTPRNGASPVHICPIWLAVEDPAGRELALGTVAPNPVHRSLSVHFALPREAQVRLDVFDVQGRAVATLAQGVFPAGEHQVTWNAAREVGAARSGVYFIRLQALGKALVRRFVLTR
jgi:predicted extracellular nuclease